MTWDVRFKPSGLRDFRALPAQVQTRVGRCLDALAENPHPRGAAKLEGGDEFYRVRVGDYRVVYATDAKHRIATVVKIGHRGDVYRRR